MSDFAEWARRAAANDGESVEAIFAEEPVSLSCFVQDKQYLGNPALSPVQYDAVRHIERIFYPKTYLAMERAFDIGKKHDRLSVGPFSTWREEPYWSYPIRMTNFITLQWGKGSGKDHVCRIALLRIAYLLLCLKSPQKYFGMPEQDTIHLLNVASSSQQAQQAFFNPLPKVVKTGWFKNKATTRQNTISFAKNVEAISGHSDAESQEGLNLLLGIADEIDAFRSKKEIRRTVSEREPTKSAEGILNMMRTSASTRFPDTFKNVRISFPRYLGSTIQQLTKQAKEDIEANGVRSRHYCSGPLPTWEVNPRVPGKEAFAEDYREDPVLARAKYECKPSRALSPYFRNQQALDACFAAQNHPIRLEYVVEDNNGRRSWAPRYTFDKDFYPIRGAQYAMHADLAITGDRAGIAMSHVAKYTEHEAATEDEDGLIHYVRELRPTVKVDFAVWFSADIGADPPREIQIRWARQLCAELIRRGFNVRRMSFDGFQSADSMQILEDKGIESERVSTDSSEEAWRNLRDLAYEGRLIIPAPHGFDRETNPTPFLLRDELFSLTKLPNGKVDHPSDGSKDIADAVACSVLGAVALGGSEEGSDARAFWSAADIGVGHGFNLPIEIGRNSLWKLLDAPDPRGLPLL